MARSARNSTVPSPTPASKRRTAGGRGWMLASSNPTRLAITHFSLQVLTNGSYFWRLSKKRKLRCGSLGARAAPGAAGASTGAGTIGMGAGTTARSPLPLLLPITGARRLASGARFSAMKARMRSSVSVVMRPPLRRRLASLPSFTARRPKVDSASPVWRQKSEISRKMASFMRCPRRFLGSPDRGLAPTRTPANVGKANQQARVRSTTKRPIAGMGCLWGRIPRILKRPFIEMSRIFLEAHGERVLVCPPGSGQSPMSGDPGELCGQRAGHLPRHCRVAVAAAELARLHAMREGAIDGVLDAAGGLDGGGVVVAVAQPVEHHGGRQQHGGGIGQALSHDVGGGAVAGLEHGVAVTDVGRGRHAHATDQAGGEVRQNVAEHVFRHQHIEVPRPAQERRRAGVDVDVLAADAVVARGLLVKNLAEEREGAKDIGLVDAVHDAAAAARLAAGAEAEREVEQALRRLARDHQGLARLIVGDHALAHGGEQTFGRLADDDEVDAILGGADDRAWHARYQARRPHAGI